MSTTLSNDAALAAYRESVQAEIEKYEEIVAKCERKLSLLRGKLKDPAKGLNKEIRENTLRARAILGQEVPARKSNLPKKKTEEKIFSEETHDLPLEETTKEKKSGFGFFKSE
jgi:hypothetical protein